MEEKDFPYSVCCFSADDVTVEEFCFEEERKPWYKYVVIVYLKTKVKVRKFTDLNEAFSFGKKNFEKYGADSLVIEVNKAWYGSKYNY